MRAFRPPPAFCPVRALKTLCGPVFGCRTPSDGPTGTSSAAPHSRFRCFPLFFIFRLVFVVPVVAVCRVRSRKRRAMPGAPVLLKVRRPCERFFTREWNYVLPKFRGCFRLLDASTPEDVISCCGCIGSQGRLAFFLREGAASALGSCGRVSRLEAGATAKTDLN